MGRESYLTTLKTSACLTQLRIEMSGIYHLFWNERFWLPTNETWDILANKPGSDIYLPQAIDMLPCIPFGLLLFGFRFIFERWSNCIINCLDLLILLHDCVSVNQLSIWLITNTINVCWFPSGVPRLLYMYAVHQIPSG